MPARSRIVRDSKRTPPAGCRSPFRPDQAVWRCSSCPQCRAALPWPCSGRGAARGRPRPRLTRPASPARTDAWSRAIDTASGHRRIRPPQATCRRAERAGPVPDSARPPCWRRQLARHRGRTRPRRQRACGTGPVQARSAARETNPPRRAASADGAPPCGHRRSAAGSDHEGWQQFRPTTTPARAPRRVRSPGAFHRDAGRSPRRPRSCRR